MANKKPPSQARWFLRYLNSSLFFEFIQSLEARSTDGHFFITNFFGLQINTHLSLSGCI